MELELRIEWRYQSEARHSEIVADVNNDVCRLLEKRVWRISVEWESNRENIGGWSVWTVSNGEMKCPRYVGNEAWAWGWLRTRERELWTYCREMRRLVAMWPNAERKIIKWSSNAMKSDAKSSSESTTEETNKSKRSASVQEGWLIIESSG